MKDPSTCPVCGAPLAQGHRSGMCPACLLQAAMGGDSTLHPAPGEGGVAQSPPALTEHPGTRIGRYKLLEQIGEGGFGIVWMAEQEEPLRRRVALKIIKLGMDTHEVVARFEAERQALAMMEHPNIACVFDGGATATGRPYFVMELVKGVPITTYCDVNRLTTKERLELFMEVCHAVQHAHQKGVIHRDLKPSNILVTVKDDHAVPKVIDFGIAKATQVALTEKTLFTRLNQWIGTPAYMSPEQAGLGSLDVDTRSDIYSLGVLLYELLTGRPPFDPEKLLATGYDAVLRVIREEEPPKPSTRLGTMAEEELTTVAAKRGSEPAKLNRLVRGDLDWIVMKALEKDRRRRYDTANGLADDLLHHLNDQPVAAGAPSPLYLLHKLVRRHKVALIAAAAVITALIEAAAVSTWQAVVATNARDQADKAKDIATTESARANAAFQNSEHSRIELEASFYRSQIGLAYEAWDKADVAETINLLESCPAKLRGWEWNHLRRLCEPGLLSFEAFDTQSPDSDYRHPLDYLTLEGQLVFTPDGGRLCAANKGWGSAVLDSRSGQRLKGLSTTCRGDYSGHFSEDGSLYFKPPSPDGPAQIVELASGLTRPVPGVSEGKPYLLSANMEWLARLTDSTVEVSNLRKDLPIKEFTIPAKSWLTAFSRDGRWLVSSAMIETSGANGRSDIERLYEVWDTEAGNLAFRIHVQDAEFSFDEARLRLAVLRDNSFELWDLATGRWLFSKSKSPSCSWGGVAFSSDGGRLALFGKAQLPQSYERAVFALNSNTGQEIFSIQPDNEARHGDRLAIWLDGCFGFELMFYGVGAAAFSPDGRNLALGVMDRTVRLVEREPPFHCRILRGHRSAVCAVAFSPDGKRLASMDRRGTIRVWDLDDPSRVSFSEDLDKGPNVGWVRQFRMSRDGALVVWLGNPKASGRTVSALNTRTTERQEVSIPWTNQDGDIRRLMAMDEFRIASDQGVWDVSRSSWSARFQGGEVSSEIAVSRNGRLVAVRNDDRVQVWDAASGSKVGKEYPVKTRDSGYFTPFDDGSIYLAFSPDARLLAVGTNKEGDTITVYRLGIDGDSPGEVCRILGQYPLCFGPTGDWLLANRPGGGFLKADTRTGAIEREFQREVTLWPGFGTVDGWEISPDGRLAVWYDKRGSRVISLETGAILFDVGSYVRWSASFSPDGTRLAAPGADDQIRLWDVAAAKVVAKLPDRGWFTRFSADGVRLVVISPEGELSVLDGAPVETKEPTR